MIRKFRALFRRNNFERDMSLELQAHQDAYRDDLISRGATREEAEQRATREFGPLLQVKDECRDARGLYWPDALVRDLRYALRQLRKSPSFTITAVLTLALCIGANTAIYSIVDAVLFRPLPYPEPNRLVTIAVHRHGRGAEYEQIGQTGRTWQMLHQSSRALDLAVLSDDASGVNFISPTGARYVKQQRVSAGFFRVLGVPPLFGREFEESEDHPGGPALAVLGNNLWATAFYSDRNILGQKIILKGEPFTVVGVMPPGFQTSAPADLWTPLRPTVNGEGGGENYEIIGRFRAGVSRPQATSELATISPGIVSEWRLEGGQFARFYSMPLQAGITMGLRKPILILWSAVSLVLLIGCVNIAGLLLARSGSRAKEIATRLALGSGRGAIVRQLLSESLLLSLAGGFAGTALGYLALQGLKLFAQDTLGVWQTITLDGRVLAMTALTSLFASLLFGLYPALLTSRTDLRTVLSQGGRTASTSHRGWPRRILIVSEVAIGVVLLVGAGLLIRTVSTLMSLRPGFDGNHILTATLSLQDARYATASAVNRLYDESLARIREIPGVESAAVCLTLPYQRPLNEGFTHLDGANEGTGMTAVTYITPAYLDAFRIPLLAGRAFTASDRSETPRVAIVNQTFVHKYLPGRNAVGNHFQMEGKSHEIVGVIGDVQVSNGGGWGDIGPIGALPGMYIPAKQLPGQFFQVVHTWYSPSWVIRTSAPLNNLAAQLQSAVAAVDPQLPFAEFRIMDQLRSKSLALQRLETILLSTLAGLALILSALGIYGLIANSVVERTREFGIRLALGSPIARAIREIAMPGVLLSLSGLVIGCLLARGTSRLLKSLIWGVAPDDPETFMIASAALLVVALIASIAPSLRVAGINPAETLKE